MKNFLSFFKPFGTSPEKLQTDVPVNHKTGLPDEKLLNSEIRYRRLFESAKDGILILDFGSGNIVNANPFIIKILDYPIEDIIGRKLWEIGLFSNMEESERAFSELKAKGYIRFEDMPVQSRIGKVTEVEFISNVYLENKTKVIQCNIRDISDRKRAEKELKESRQNLISQNVEYLSLNKEYLIINKELKDSLIQIKRINDELNIAKVHAEESDNLKSIFLANIGHEIRTPMNSIIGFSDFLSQPGLTDEKRKEYVHIINSSSQQLLAIISDIIDISTIEAGQIDVYTDWININHLLSELFLTYKKTVEDKNLTLVCKLEHSNDNIQLKTDGNRIRQVICNLLNNAIKFTHEGSIEFGYTIEEKFIAFYVKDSGIGILAENQEIIFQRFRKVEKTDGKIYRGNGLGLSISKALVEKLQGTIWVESVLGTGSTFVFTLPYNGKPAGQIAAATTEDSARIKSSKVKKILIAEDDQNSFTLIEGIFSDTNIQLLHAWNGKEAIELVKIHPDIMLVLMDIRMPEMDGYEATMLIKQIRPEMPIIAQTAFAGNLNKKQLLLSRFDDYISKPIQKDLLTDMLAKYLN